MRENLVLVDVDRLHGLALAAPGLFVGVERDDHRAARLDELFQVGVDVIDDRAHALGRDQLGGERLVQRLQFGVGVVALVRRRRWVEGHMGGVVGHGYHSTMTTPLPPAGALLVPLPPPPPPKPPVPLVLL